ncbi:MAG: EAL domain-containing protein [Candidatus Manganitrophus sp. SA1]|nr:EAL domain-containing protein [Candidatus Manganitrophus morganii]
MDRPLRILIIEDSEEDAELLLLALRRAGYELLYERVETPAAMDAALAKQAWDVIVSDYTMPNFSGPAALRQLKESGRDLPFIIVSGSIGEETAVETMRLGAHDYILKGNLTRLAPAIERELREAQIRCRRKQAEEETRLLQSITLAVSEAKDLRSALEVALRKVGEASGWILGQAWVPRSDVALLQCSPAVFSSAPGLESFRKWSEGLSFPPGVEIPGLAWSGKKPVWLRDITAGSDSPRAQIAREVGLRTGVGIPVLAADEVVAVMEFFAREPRKEDERLIEIISSAAIQLGSVIQRKRSEEKLKYMAYYDLLTDLPNRAHLRDLLRETTTAGAPEGGRLSLLCLDLNHFREVNDALGRNLGDSLLQQIGPRLKSVLGGADTVARLGADEFAVVLPGINQEDAISVACKILKAMEAHFVVGALALEIGVSIGIALYPDHGEEADTLMQAADAAMYVAKQSDNGYAVYVPERDQPNPRRLALIGELRRAIEDNQLFPHYQPKINIKTGRIIGVETLIRWQHPHFGLIPPDQFIMMAEQTGLIKPLTYWVLNAALCQCEQWRRQGLTIPVAVNLSARNLQDSQLPERVSELLQKSGVEPDQLALEITESIIMADPQRAMEILTDLSEMGIRLSIDDFGTGYSSLGYLKKLPVDEVKIDKSFVREMASNQDDIVIVRSTIDLAHNLGLEVVAEGVENQETLSRLAALGCDAAQGYFISRPVAAANLPRWLNETACLKGWRV